MDPALASLLGAVIGGGAVSSSNIGLEMYRTRRDRTREAHREQREARQAARLIAQELRSGRRLILSAQERGYFTWQPPERRLPAAAWTEHRAISAGQAPNADWAAISLAYTEFDRLNWLVLDVLSEESFMEAQSRAPWEGPALGPAAEIAAVLAKVDDGLGRLSTMETPKT